MTRVVGVRVSGKVWDADKLYTNISEEPQRFSTENDLRKACRAIGVNSGALL